MTETRVWPLSGEKSPGEGNGNPFQYSCLGNIMDRKGGLGGYSSWGRKELHTTEQLTLNLPPTHISPREGHKYLPILPSVPPHDLRRPSSNQDSPWPGYQHAFSALPPTAAQSLFPVANDTSEVSHYLWATPELPQINGPVSCFLLWVPILPCAAH